MAGVTFQVSLDDFGIPDGLSAMAQSLDDLSPLMEQLGQLLVASAKERIGTTNVAPDGSSWPPSLRALALGGPTLNASGLLRDSINAYTGGDYVEVGTNVPYAAVHQFGAVVGSLGVWVGSDKHGREKTVLSPWGDIPARPYLGMSDDDDEDVRHLTELFFSEMLDALARSAS